MPQDINDVLQDKDFQAASAEARQAFLVKHFPEYGKASPEAQREFLNKHSQKASKDKGDADTFTAGFKSTFPSWKELKETGKGLIGIPEEGVFSEQGSKQAGARTALRTVGKIGTGIYEQQKGEFKKAFEEQEKSGKAAPSVSGFGHFVAGALPVFGPMASSAGEDIGAGKFRRGFGKAAGTFTQLLGPKALKGAVKGAGAAAEAVRGIMPEVEVIQGVKIPRLASEVRPVTMAGRSVKMAKKLGLNEKGFTEFAQKQNQAVKEVIRKVAEGTAKKSLGPLLDNPAQA